MGSVNSDMEEIVKAFAATSLATMYGGSWGEFSSVVARSFMTGSVATKNELYDQYPGLDKIVTQYKFERKLKGLLE